MTGHHTHRTQKQVQSTYSLKILILGVVAVSAVAGVGYFSVTPDASARHNEHAAEIRFTETSPQGSEAGEIIPASCASNLHDAPLYGTACTSAANACGQTQGGTYQCYGATNASGNGNLSGTPNCSVGPPAVTTPTGATYGAACTTSANACGQTNTGTIQCDGYCSVTTPANPVGYGNPCTSAANTCGATNSGTYTCSGGSPTLYCTATPPADPVLPATCSCLNPPPNYLQSCTSSANVCGKVNQGTIACNGSCSVGAPPDTDCGVSCGNGICDAHETSATCPTDCPDSGTPITGWGWSDNVGWISLNCSDPGTCATRSYRMKKTSANKIVGMAWSENIGWVSANPADLAGCPSGTCEASISSTGRVSGWMKAISAASGWDGWISLNGTGYQTMYESDNTLSSWGWGSDVVGWVLWSAQLPCAQTAGDYCSGDMWMHRTPQCVTSTILDCRPSTCSTTTNQCVTNPPPTTIANLRASPTLVAPGRTSVISWNVKNATSCTVSGNGNSWTGVSGSQTSNPINQVVTYSLSCTGIGGTLNQTVTIKFAPKWNEK